VIGESRKYSYIPLVRCTASKAQGQTNHETQYRKEQCRDSHLHNISPPNSSAMPRKPTRCDELRDASNACCPTSNHHQRGDAFVRNGEVSNVDPYHAVQPRTISMVLTYQRSGTGVGCRGGMDIQSIHQTPPTDAGWQLCDVQLLMEWLFRWDAHLGTWIFPLSICET
jgi:hypothetical protein